MSEDTSRTDRNAVFAATPPADGPTPTSNPHQAYSRQGYQTSNVLKDDFGFEIPVENVPLPSLGVVYGHDDPLYGKETVEIRAMTAREEDILTSRALIRKGTVISKLLSSCIIDKTVSVDRMLSGDRNAIMTAIRVTGYGADYDVEVACPACSERSKQTFDLAELPIKRLELEPVSPGANLFEVDLPMTKKRVRFKFLTGADENDLMRASERSKKTGQETDNLVTQRFQRQIVSVNEITDKNKINFFIRGMPARDSLFLRKHIDQHEPGIDMKSWMHCPQCGEHSEVKLPMGASFFWPESE